MVNESQNQSGSPYEIRLQDHLEMYWSAFFEGWSMVLGMFLLQETNWVALLALCATINGSSAFGDVWFALLVLRYPKSAYIVDERYGVRVLMWKA